MNRAVAFDLSCLEARAETGVERYARRLVEHLPRVAPDLQILVLVRTGRPAPRVPPPGRIVEVASLLPRPAWRETALPRALHEHGARVLHSPVAALPLRGAAARIATIHDVPEFGAPGHEGLLSRHRLRLLHAVRVAARIVVPSVATREALVRFDPRVKDRIHVIPHGVDPDFRPQGVPLQRERYGIPPGPFLLWVGTIRPRKDPTVLIDAFLRVLAAGHPDLHLVMCGDLRMDADVLKTPMRAAGLENRLVLPGYVAREDLPDLYREAELVVIPSRLEGFGLPALEAMACGRALVVSSDAALLEVTGEAAQSFRTGDPHDLARVLRHLLRDAGARDTLSRLAVERAKRHSWEGSARAHADIYRSLLDAPVAEPAVPR